MNDKTFHRPLMSPEERLTRDRRALVRAIPSEDLRAMHQKVRGDKAAQLTATDLHYLIDNAWDEFRPALRDWCKRTIDGAA